MSSLHEKALLDLASDGDKLRYLVDYFDALDQAALLMGVVGHPSREVQLDLERMAKRLDELDRKEAN